jgi:hypothetical protein
VATLSTAETALVLEHWPDGDANLPASVDAAFKGWKALTLASIDPAIARLNDDSAVGFMTPSPASGFVKASKCRTLTARGVAPPLGQPPLVLELRSMLPGSSTAGADEQIKAQLLEMAERLRKQELTIAALLRQAAADDKDDVTADYEVNATVVEALPQSFFVQKGASTNLPRVRWHLPSRTVAELIQDVRVHPKLQGDAVGKEDDFAAIFDGSQQVHGP